MTPIKPLRLMRQSLLGLLALLTFFPGLNPSWLLPHNPTFGRQVATPLTGQPSEEDRDESSESTLSPSSLSREQREPSLGQPCGATHRPHLTAAQPVRASTVRPVEWLPNGLGCPFRC